MKGTKGSPLFTALLCASLVLTLLGEELSQLPAERRIQNNPPRRHRPWNTDYSDEEDPVLVSSQQRLRPIYFRGPILRRRPPMSQYPRAISFNGDFHIGHDQFVSFGVGDAMVGGPPSSELRHPDSGQFRPPERAVPFVSSGESTSEVQDGSVRPGIPAELLPTTKDTPGGPYRVYVNHQSLYYDPPATTTPTPNTAEIPTSVLVVTTPVVNGVTSTNPKTNPTPNQNYRQHSDFKESLYFTRNVTERVIISEAGGEGDDELLKDGAWSAEDAPIREREESAVWNRNEWGGGGGGKGVEFGGTRDQTGPEFISSTTPLPNLNRYIATERTIESLTDTYLPSDLANIEPRWVESSTPTSRTMRPWIPPQAPKPFDYRGDDETGLQQNVTPSYPDVSSEKPPYSGKDRRAPLSTGAIVGIAIGILAPLALVAGAVVYLLYGRRLKGGGPKGESRAIAERACNYIDDSVRVSGFMNSHIELPKESSEEMTSLDNDSFLNSLEAVTIQNYWAETAKNTKV